MSSKSITVRDFRTEIPGEMSWETNTWIFPVINSINAHNRDTFWQIHVRLFMMDPSITLPNIPQSSFVPIKDEYFDCKPLVKNIHGWISVSSGIVGMKTREVKPTIVTEGKNIGKKSATNSWTQSLRDAYGLYNKQLKKSAPSRSHVSTVLIPPMLAQEFEDNTNDYVYIQRKYNGVRAVSTLNITNNSQEVIMYSRNKNLYPTFSYIKEELRNILAEYPGQKLYLDGEIYLHGVPLQIISGDSRKLVDTTDVRYDYMIFDCFISDQMDMTFSNRKNILDTIFKDNTLTYTKLVETIAVNSPEEVKRIYKQFVEEGFEGAMVRKDEKYMPSINGRRSSALVKLKPVYDGEFAIISYTTGTKGKAANALMLTCETSENKPFAVTPAMTLDEREALVKKMAEVEPNGRTHFENHWYKQKIIVYYEELSTGGIPLRGSTKMEKRTWD